MRDWPRRDFLGLMAASPLGAAAVRRPNIVLVLADTLGYRPITRDQRRNAYRSDLYEVR